jgi:hypothetical protein
VQQIFSKRRSATRQATVPHLPPEVMEMLARAAFAAEERTTHAWRRLSLVSRTWRYALRGGPSSVVFSAPMSSPQYHWLTRTRVPFKVLRFHPSDTMAMGLVASAVGRNYRSIAALHDTLEELFLRSHKDFSGTLAHFIALRRLEIEGLDHPTQMPRLPVSLEELTLHGLDRGMESPQLHLAELTQLTLLNLLGYETHMLAWDAKHAATALPSSSPQRVPRLRVAICARTVMLHELCQNGLLMSHVHTLDITAKARQIDAVLDDKYPCARMPGLRSRNDLAPASVNITSLVSSSSAKSTTCSTLAHALNSMVVGAARHVASC